MARNDTKELLSRLGGEVSFNSRGYQRRNTQENLRLNDPSAIVASQPLKNELPSKAGKNIDVAISFFQKKGIPEQLARTYGAALVEAAQRTGKDVSELVKFDENNKPEFTDIAYGQMNVLRKKTSQIGYKTPSSGSNEYINRQVRT